MYSLILKYAYHMKDVHSTKSKKYIDINEVGVRDMLFPISIKGRDGLVRGVIAKMRLSVDLSNYQKGAHMSRFLEVINTFEHKIINEDETMYSMLKSIKRALQSNEAHIHISFPFYMQKEAPVSKKSSLMTYTCALGGTIDSQDRIRLCTKMRIPISTVCPCSKEISEEGAHNQRGEVRLNIDTDQLISLEDLINLVEAEGSQHVYPLLKRVDEKEVTESMFRNPKFVEDVVRGVALKLNKDKRIKNFNISCTNYESIHSHNVYAKIRNMSK